MSSEVEKRSEAGERFKAVMGFYESAEGIIAGLRMSAKYWRAQEPSDAAPQPRIMADFHERAADTLDRLTRELAESRETLRPTHRHAKRDTEYTLLGYGRMQAARWFMRDANIGTMPVDMFEVAVYRSVDDGSPWVRPRTEFEDGRFVALNSSPDTSKEPGNGRATD